MRKKTNFNPDLLKEELNRFKLLNEYSFIPMTDEEKQIILGNKHLEEEEQEESPEDSIDGISNELGMDNPDPNAAPQGDDMGADMGDDTMNGDVDPNAAPEPAPAPVEPAPAPEAPANDDVEVDVTELVKGSEEAKMAADKASQNTEMLMQKLTDLESRISSMDAVSGKIAELEQEIIKRNPTPNEKLELQVTKSFPYSQSLENYWSDKSDYLNDDEKTDEYTLTQDDVDNSYSEGDIKQSFTVKDEDFTEEDI